MRRIVVLTEEQKKAYAAKAEEFQKISLWRKSKKKRDAGLGHARCPKCSKRYGILNARGNGHDGFCSKRCLRRPGKPTIRAQEVGLSTIEKRQRRQIRRQERLKNQVVGFYESREWRELRFKVLRKYGPTCMACFKPGSPGNPMHVDHIKPRSKYPELELDIDNLQILCEDCNLGKCNYTEEDLRPKSALDFK